MPNTKKYDNEFDYMQELRRFPVARDSETVAKLVEQWRTRGDQQAYNQLVYGNSRLVLSIAGRYKNRGLALFDLVQEGFIGLMRALEDFDPKQSKISTYATLWIRQAILHALANHSRAIRIPRGQQSKMSCIRRAIKDFSVKYERQPNNQEVYDGIHALDGTENETATSKKMTLRDVDFYRTLLFETEVYLDEPANPTLKDSRSFGEILADSRVDIRTDIDARRLQQNVLERIKCRLQEEENPWQMLTILRFRFEFDQTLEYTGDRFGISRERIRQIEKKFITKIAEDLKTTVKNIKNVLVELPLGVYGLEN